MNFKVFILKSKYELFPKMNPSIQIMNSKRRANRAVGAHPREADTHARDLTIDRRETAALLSSIFYYISLVEDVEDDEDGRYIYFSIESLVLKSYI